MEKLKNVPKLSSRDRTWIKAVSGEKKRVLGLCSTGYRACGFLVPSESERGAKHS